MAFTQQQLCWVLGKSSPCAQSASVQTAPGLWIGCADNSSRSEMKMRSLQATSSNSSGTRIMRSLQAIALPPLQPPSMPHCVSTVTRGSVIAQSQASSDTTGKSPVITDFKHVLLPIIDRNPYLSESTRQAAATTTALAKKYGADITVLVIVQNAQQTIDAQEAKDKHELQLKTIRWHLAQGGFEDYTMVEKLGEGQGQEPAAMIGELADDLGLDLVIMCMEAIHRKHIDGNLLVEFVPCPVLMLPL